MGLLAVCQSGCPDFKPSCADIYNQENCTESHTEDGCLHCPIWPETWNSTMQWQILTTPSGSPAQKPQNVTSNAYCCKRKPMECDTCNQGTCSGLIGLFHNNCPPNGGGFIHHQSKLQKDCCVQHESITGFPVCECDMVKTECDHSQEEMVVSTVRTTPVVL